MVQSGIMAYLASFGAIAIAIVAADATAFAQEPSNALDVELGKSLFDRLWVTAPASTTADDGLGPLFNASSCLSCHPPDSPYRAPEDSIHPGIIIRLGNAAGDADPIYGVQMQTRSVRDILPEVLPDIVWGDDNGRRIAELDLTRVNYGPLAPETRAALRRAPAIAGVGLLASIPKAEILARENPGAAGISGRAAWLTDEAGNRALGRFGWRAAQPNLAAQTESAFSNDLGMSTSGRPAPWGECSEAEASCRAAPHGAEAGEFEIPDVMRDLIVSFLENAPPPAPAPSETAGERVFNEIGCVACHAILHLADGREIRAYTDLLLHDLGAGLNDGIAEGAAAPGEWRTAPLWGLSAISKLGGLLHDGRAPDVEQAIAWHGGEAENTRSRFTALTPEDKASLLTFVNGL